MTASRKTPWVIVFVVALLAVCAPAAHAGVAIEIGLSQLANRANAVVVGTSIESRSMWEQSEGRTRIVTYHRVAIEKVAAGKLEGTETWVRTLGGQVGDIGQRVDGEAVLPRGKKLLLFLAARAEGGTRVVAMAQGVWLLVKGEDGVERIKPSLERGMIVPNPERTSATADISGRTLAEAIVRVTAARATHAP
jgi:hypothetical protein